MRSFEESNIKELNNTLITSIRNPLVKRLRLMAKRDKRDSSSFLLLEGTQLLKEALQTSFKPKEIIVTLDWLNKHSEIISNIPEDILIHRVTPSVLKHSLSIVNPDGVATILPIDDLPRPSSSLDFVLALDRLQDPGNLGTLFRTALASDVQALLLALGADPLNQKVLRASSGAVLKLPYKRFVGSEKEAIALLAKELQILAESGHQVVGTFLPEAKAPFPVVPYWELDWLKPTVLVLGNEGSGIHPQIQTSCTHGVTLPHNSSVESLNVAAAAVPMLLERRRAKMTFDLKETRERS